MTARRRRLRRRGDEGSALVEFTYLAVLLMVPLVYLMVTVFQLQRAAFAVSSAAREGGRAYATAVDEDQAVRRAEAAAAIALRDHGLSEPVQLTPVADDGFVPGARVEVVVTYRVPLPALGVLGIDSVGVRVTGRHTATVERFRSR